MVALMLALAISDPSAKEEARTVLRRVGCQKCHDSALSLEHTDALGQFDLKDPNWSDGLSDRQLPILLVRMGKRAADDVKIVRRFVDAELRARKH
jgi:hypothetical protein